MRSPTRTVPIDGAPWPATYRATALESWRRLYRKWRVVAGVRDTAQGRIRRARVVDDDGSADVDADLDTIAAFFDTHADAHTRFNTRREFLGSAEGARPRLCTGLGRAHTYHDLLTKQGVFDEFLNIKCTATSCDICFQKTGFDYNALMDREIRDALVVPVVRDATVFRGEEFVFDYTLFDHCVRTYGGILSPALQFQIVHNDRSNFGHLSLETFVKAWFFLQNPDIRRRVQVLDDFKAHVNGGFTANPFVLTATSRDENVCHNFAGVYSEFWNIRSFECAIYHIRLNDAFVGYERGGGEAEIVCAPLIPIANVVRIDVYDGRPTDGKLKYTLSPPDFTKPKSR